VLFRSRSILRGQLPIIRSDGQFVRDYFYVEDGAAAYMFLAEKLAENPSILGQAYNFSNERPLTVIELVNLILQEMGAAGQPVILNEANNEIRVQVLSAQKAHDQLGWLPLFTLEDGIRQTIQWYREFLQNG
jgi:CDP-glucose 4,6-dehydratase